jgi:hypothetical protein
MHVKSIQFLSLIGILLLPSCADITFEEPAAQPPLAEIGVTKRDGSVAEVFARLRSGTHLTNVLDISIFEGLHYKMTRVDLTERLGEPKSVRIHPEMRLEVDIYAVPQGEIGFMSVPTSGGSPNQSQVWAFPTNQSPAAIIRDESLRSQLLSIVPGDRSIRVAVLRGDPGRGGITLTMSSNRIESLILGPRDGE